MGNSKLSVVGPLIFTFCILNLLGCATYKFQRGSKPYDKGYVALRDDYTILEYTIGKENSVPELKLAKERFNRRRKIVERYYKKMGYVENRFKAAFWNPCIYSFKMLKGIFSLPFIIVSEYRMGHNPKYRGRITKLEDDSDARQEAYIKKLRDELNAYIQQDIAVESEATSLP